MQKKRLVAALAVSAILLGGVVLTQQQNELEQSHNGLLAKHTRCAAYAEIAGMDANSIEAHTAQGYSESKKQEYYREIAVKDIQTLLSLHEGMSLGHAASGLYRLACAKMLDINKDRYTRQASI